MSISKPFLRFVVPYRSKATTKQGTFWHKSTFLYSRLVIETLEKQEKDKRCFRLVGGVLVERKVGEVEPALVSNRDKVRICFN